MFVNILSVNFFSTFLVFVWSILIPITCVLMLGIITQCTIHVYYYYSHKIMLSLYMSTNYSRDVNLSMYT